ncbi:MAG: hypothetical protein HFACDABA_01835 [Anaerolineales bacterium]|nr:hypothetical protein [Anaerolineales bacterium]
MDAQIEISNMQPADAIPLEDRSLPASETLKEQQADIAEKDFAPVFVP